MDNKDNHLVTQGSPYSERDVNLQVSKMRGIEFPLWQEMFSFMVLGFMFFVVSSVAS